MTIQNQPQIIIEPGQPQNSTNSLWFPATMSENDGADTVTPPQRQQQPIIVDDIDEIDQKLRNHLGFYNKPVEVASLQTYIQSLTLPSSPQDALTLNIDDGGTIALQQNKIIADGLTNPQNYEHYIKYEQSAAIMVAHAIEQGWPSIALNGHDKQLKDTVFVEAFLQGMPVDFSQSKDYVIDDKIITDIEERCAHIGIDIKNDDGVNDYRNAFGRGRLEDRFFDPSATQNPTVNHTPEPETPVVIPELITTPTQLVNPFEGAMPVFESMPPPPHTDNSNTIDVTAIPVVTATTLNDDTEINPDQVGALNEEPILSSATVPETEMSPQFVSDLNAVLNMLNDGEAELNTTPDIMSEPDTTTGQAAPIQTSKQEELPAAAPTSDDKVFDGFYLEAHHEDKGILRIRSTPLLAMFHGGIPPQLKEAAQELRQNSRDARLEALKELEDAVGTAAAPTSFQELAQHQEARSAIAEKFSGQTPYTGITETDKYYVGIVESMTLEGPRQDRFPVYDLTTNNAAELIVWADKTKYASPEDFADAVQKHAANNGAADFRRYRSYFGNKTYEGPDISDAEYFPPYSNPLPEPKTPAPAQKQKTGLFGTLEVPATNLEGFRAKTVTDNPTPAPAPPPPPPGMKM